VWGRRWWKAACGEIETGKLLGCLGGEKQEPENLKKNETRETEESSDTPERGKKSLEE